jgi:hypothetical protein
MNFKNTVTNVKHTFIHLVPAFARVNNGPVKTPPRATVSVA